MKIIFVGLARKRIIKLAVLCAFGFGVTGLITGERSFFGIHESKVSAQTQCPAAPPVTISPQPPADVCLPAQISEIPFKFFDDFSWRSFVALVWPARPGERGVPDPTKTIGDPGPLVFETYKADWEIFQPEGKTPSPWNEYGGVNPCQNVTPRDGDLVLESFSKFANLGQAGFGPLVGPLVAQNKTYVRYQAAFDRIGFGQMLDRKLYLRSNLGTPAAPLIFNDSSTDIKSAWIEMTGIEHPERYHTRTAWILTDPESNECAQKTVGLVGLHIVVKTPLLPQWLWASFEQIDNIPQSGAQAPFAFNDGSGTLMPARNPIPFPPPAQAPAPYNVTRTVPISDSTQQTNKNYQQALKTQGSGVWQYYQLVMTQWPVPQSSPANPGTPAKTFPGTGAATSFANTTMETFFQANVTTGCMACHNLVKAKSDFNWTLANHAFSQVNPPTPFSLSTNEIAAIHQRRKRQPLSPELTELKKLLMLGRSRPPTASEKKKTINRKKQVPKKQISKPVRKKNQR